MSSSRSFAHVVVAALVVATLAACGSSRNTPEAPPLGEMFTAEDTYSRNYPVPPGVSCEAARRALLGQGYVIDKHAVESLEASKVFQPQSDVHTKLNVRTTCVPMAGGGSIVFINAVQDRFALMSQSSSASVGVSMVGSVSVPIPIGGNNANLVRVGSNTVQNQDFYQGLFDRVGLHLPGTPADVPLPPVPDTPPDPVLPLQP